ncbi:MAG: ATP-binding protein [Acidimicrobiales bacterium]
MKRDRLLSGAVLGVGAVIAIVLAVNVGTPIGDTAVLLGSTAAFSIAVAVAARWYLAWRGEASLRSQILVVSTAAVATVVVGTLAAAKAMFISVHDLNALIAVMTIAVAVAVAASLSLASRFQTDTNALSVIADRMVDQPKGPVDTIPFGIREMRQLASRLELVSAQLESSRERERTLDRSRRELVSWVSHDLRSPLASIRALAEALEDGIAASEHDRRRYYQSIRHESERLTALVDDLFVLSRIQAGAIVTTSATAPVAELVEDAVIAIVHRAEINGVSVECDVAEIGGRMVPAADVTRALSNLLDNAVRHTQSGGVIVVEGRADAGSIVLSVRDQCGGIPETEIGRVFETAFRGDSARGRDGGGGGLGLAIARGLVEAHAGKIDVRNYRLGCQFNIRIPAPKTASSR